MAETNNARKAQQSVRRAARAGALEKTTRIGFIGYGLLHLAIAWLAVQIALGRPGTEGDQTGAFRALAAQPFGTVLLIVVAVGLAAMALWQLLLAALGHQAPRGLADTAERVTSAARASTYAVLAWTASRVVAGAQTSGTQQSQHVTAGIMDRPAGQFLTGLLGVIVVVLGLGMVYYGARKKFEKRLMTVRMSGRVRRLARRLGQLGYIAKGIAFTVVGVLLIDAAATHNPARSRGLDAALRALAGQPFGTLLLSLIAAGFGAFGLYCFLQAKYRTVTV